MRRTPYPESLPSVKLPLEADARFRQFDFTKQMVGVISTSKSVRGRNSRRMEGPDWDRFNREINSARWLVWHGKGRKAVARLQAINEELEKWPNQETNRAVVEWSPGVRLHSIAHSISGQLWSAS